MRPYLHQHLQSTVILEQGRCIKLTLNFKNRKILNIYGIYLPPTSGNNDHIKTIRFNNICKILFEDLLKEKSRDHLYETILGDFNINYKKHILNNNKSISYSDALQKTKTNKLEHWMCYKILKILNFDNVASMFNKVLEPTWFPPVNSKSSPTTVDYIWVSTNLKEITSHFHISRTPYSSDHAILMVAFPHFNNDFINHKSFDKSRNQPDNNNNRYNLSTLSPDDWVTFNNKVDNYILTTANITLEPTHKDVTDYMDQLNKIIFDVLEDMKVKKIKITPKRNNLPLHLRQKYNQIHQLTSLKAILKEASYSLSEDFTTEISPTKEQRKGLKNNFDRLWVQKSNWVKKLFRLYKINHSLILLNHTLNSISEIEEININISNLILHIETLIQKERKEWDVKQIEYFINRRNEDIKSNQKRALNSILERNPRKIILDRIKYYDGDELKYSTDPKIINEKANYHFQNIGSSSKSSLTYDPLHEMPEPWRSVYSLKTNIKQDAINQLSLPISMDELLSTIKSLPNNKAPGPSGIPYEIFKKLPPNFLNTLLQFYNVILDSGKLPSSWQEALLYPIPKPTWWDNDIKHTRPIVLLDTFRKLLVKIINTRLNYYLSSNDILQPNNRAGTQGSSCMEIIFTIQSAITAAKQLNKKLYILIQDLSKAYDRVEIPLLRRALLRICIPEKIIDFIINLFTDRKNSILLESGVGDQYDVINGIDQGETICPLLWVIYYDPMFQKINDITDKEYEGIQFEASLPRNIYRQDVDDMHKEILSAKVLGYLDDTTWLSSDLNCLERNLAIADSFYQLANIKINKDKTVILSNNRKEGSNMVNLRFGDENINVKMQPMGKGTRILGVYLHADGSNSTTLAKINSMVNYTSFLIRKKKLTHDHVIYVINKVIIPRIEYLSQHLFLSSSYCAKLNSRLRSLFKNSLQLPRNTYNSVLHSRIYPHIVNIFDNQLKAQSSLFLAQANCPYTSNIIKFLLLLTQQKYNLPFNSFDFFTLFNSPLKRFTRLESLFVFFKYYNISLTTYFQFKVKGGNTPISHYVIDPKYLYSHIMSLRTKGIMFLDQIITEESAYLKEYKDIKESLRNKQGRIPRWYNFLKDHLTLSDSNRLNIEIDKPLVKNSNVTRLTPPAISANTYSHKSSNKWIVTWSPQILDVVYGRALSSTNFEHSVPILYAQHWICIPNNNSQLTPRSRPNLLQPCPGCQLHFPYYIGDSRINCIIKVPYSRTIRAYTQFQKNVRLFSNNLSSQLIRTAKIMANNHEYYRIIAYNDHLIRSGLVPDDSHISNSLNNASPQNLNYQLITSLIMDRSIQSDLWHVSYNIQNFSNLIIYTDGSFNPSPATNEFHMGYGWHVSNITDPLFFHFGSLEHFPSSTKAEIMAILTALMVAPYKSDVIIYTDSQAAISGFHKSANLRFISPRRFNKINHTSLWSTIHHIINKLEIRLQLIKVKAHSSNTHNDRADELAKLGRTKATPTSLKFNGITNLNISLKWNDEIIIDKDIRKTMGQIIDYRWLDNHMNHNNLSDILEFTKKHLINWVATTKFFHQNSRGPYTSALHDKDIGWIIKSSTNTLATLDVLNRNFPKLINNDTLCLLCKGSTETNEHIWKCPALLPHIRSCFMELAENAQTILHKYADKLNLCITDSIKYSNTFRWAFRPDEELTDNAILLLRSYISEDLYRSFRTHFNTQTGTFKALFKFMEISTRLIKRNIWKIRSVAWKKKKQVLNINKNSFKRYQRGPRSNNGRSSRRQNFGYICPQTASLGNYHNRADLLFVILASSNFLHSGVIFNQLTYDLPDNISFYSYPSCPHILMA